MEGGKIEGVFDKNLLAGRRFSQSNGALYRQLAEEIRKWITTGKLEVGSELPKEAELAALFEVSLITVRNALRELSSEGLILKRSAKPAVVAKASPTRKMNLSFDNFRDMEAFTENASLEVKSFGKVESPIFKRYFNFDERETGYCLKAILAVDNLKQAQIVSYFPPEVGSKLKLTDFSDVLIFKSVQKRLGLRLDAARITVKAEIADAEIAGDLDIDIGGPILTVEMLYQTADHQCIEFTIARHSAELFKISFDSPNDT